MPEGKKASFAEVTNDGSEATKPMLPGVAVANEKTPLTPKDERLARTQARPADIGKLERKSTLGYGHYGFNQRSERKAAHTKEKTK